MKKKDQMKKAKQNQTYDELTEKLLQEPYLVIDFLPRQVPKDSEGQFFAVERYCLAPVRRKEYFRKMAEILIGVACYYELALGDGEGWVLNPAPNELFAQISKLAENGCRTVLLPGCQALFTLNGCDLYMTLFHPSKELEETVRALASAQGFFVREGMKHE